MSDFRREYYITFTDKRCSECGVFWAIEQGKWATCPCCAARSAARFEDQILKLERRVKNLRKALGRLK
jgi:hypothetical protein